MFHWFQLSQDGCHEFHIVFHESQWYKGSIILRTWKVNFITVGHVAHVEHVEHVAHMEPLKLVKSALHSEVIAGIKKKII